MVRKSNRRSEEREIRQSFLIICAEGKNSKTEKNYFNGIKRELFKLRYSAKIEPITANISEIDDLLKLNKDYNNKWIVVDKDQQNLDDLISKYNNSKSRVAFSNFCFEYWLLLHFTNQHPTAITKCKQYDIDKVIPGYKKDDIEIYQKVKEKEQNAIKRAKTNLNTHKQRGGTANKWTSSTNMFELIEEIRKAQENI